MSSSSPEVSLSLVSGDGGRADGDLAGGYVAGTVEFSAVDGPGNRFVVFLQGCQLDCLACHNPCSIPVRPKGMLRTSAAEVHARIRDVAGFLSGVTVSGGEAMLQPHFVRDLFTLLAKDPGTARLTRLVDSNADVDAAAWELVEPVMDGAMLDLKALDPQMHLILTGVTNERVLAGMERLAARRLLYEVRLLLVPGLNDSDDALRRTARWLLGLDPQMRVRVNAFRSHGTRPCGRDLLEPDAADLARYRSVLTDTGIHHLSIPRVAGMA